MTAFLKREFSGWSIFEVLWTVFVCLTITALAVFWNDTVWGIISAVTGVLYVIFTGKGKILAFGFGIVNCVLYSAISYGAQLYGETILNVFYYLPMMFVGICAWNKNMDQETRQVKKRHMTNMGRLLLCLGIGTATFMGGKLLKSLGDAMPYIDSFTTVASVIAMIVSVKRYGEQWWIWLAVNSVSIYMWWQNFAQGNDNMATLIMWVVYLINGVFILVKWERELKNERREKNGYRN